MDRMRGSARVNIRRQDVADLLGVSRAYLSEMVRKGKVNPHDLRSVVSEWVRRRPDEVLEVMRAGRR